MQTNIDEKTKQAERWKEKNAKQRLHYNYEVI